MTNDTLWGQHQRLLFLEDPEVAETLGFTSYEAAAKLPDSTLQTAADFFAADGRPEAVTVLVDALAAALADLQTVDYAAHRRLIKPLTGA